MVSSFKAFCFLFRPSNKTFWKVIFVHHWKTKRFMNIFWWTLLIVLVLKFSHSNVYYEAAKLRALHAKNILTCQRVLRAYVLTCQCALRASVLLRTCSRAKVLVLMPLFLVLLPLLLKLCTLLKRFKSLITVFPQ